MILDDHISKKGNTEAREKLEDAIVQEDVAVVKQLVRDNPQSVNAQDKHGRTPLHFAATEGKADAARTLLGNNAIVDVQDNWGYTPLFLAIFDEPLVLERVPIVSLLIENGADIHSRDDAGNTPLHMAAFGEAEIVRLLLEQGADVNAVNDAGETPLHKAVLYPEYAVVRELLRHGADRSVRSAQGQTPMQIAKERGWVNLVELLNSAAIEREAVR